MSGMASSEAARMPYTLNSTAAATRSQTSTFKRMTALMTLRIIRPFQLMFSVDEKTAKRDDLRILAESVAYLCVELPLHAGVNFLGHVLSGLPLHVHDLLVALLDDRFIRNGQEWPPLDDDLDDIECRVRPS